MTAPTPDDGKFVTSDAVVARFEGTFPPGRVTWLKWRILDVENELLGEVPSLRTIDVNSTDDAVKIRVGRVRSLIIDKLLDLYRNPTGATSQTHEMDGFRESHTRDGGGNSGTVSFTEEELNRVRLPKRRRPRLGTYGVTPPGRRPC
ncbi:MAG: hypothetical protein PGN30_10195 [Mycolicibacterium neoaurum]|uniref:hypothetical protein n=1 Tax=Mycolicibacterium neoaurum TaxID=1795 RepID=UPI002FF78C73